MNCQCNSANVAEILTAIGTLLAVVVALFGKDIRNLWAGPRIELRLYSETGELSKTNDGIETLFYHILAKNTKRDAANNALIYLTQVDEDWEGGKRNLWIGKVPMRWMFAEFSSSFVRTLGEEKCDLVSVTKDRLVIMTVFSPNNLQTIWENKCNLYLTFNAVSDQNAPKALTLHIVWDGIWSKDTTEMKKHISIQPV